MSVLRITDLPSTPAASTLALSGELDISTVAHLERKLRSLTAPQVLVDLRELSFVDSTALRLLVGEHTRAEREGRSLTFVRGPAHVQRVFEITKLDGRLRFVDVPPDPG